MVWTQATVNNLKPKERTYKKSEDNLIVRVSPIGHISYYAYIRRKDTWLGNHPVLTLRNAKKKKETMFADMYMGRIEETKMTFQDFFFSDDFQTWSIGHRKTHKARLESAKATILPLIGKVKLAMISNVDINRYKNARLKDGVKHSTINRELSDISGVLTQAFKYKLINQPIQVEKYKEDRGKERRVLEDWEVKSIRESARDNTGLRPHLIAQKRHIAVVIDIAYYCGLRKGEILQLTWGDIVRKGHFHKQFVKDSVAKGFLESSEDKAKFVEAWKDSKSRDYAFAIRGETVKTNQTRLVPVAQPLLSVLRDYYSHFLSNNKKEYEEWFKWTASITEGKQTGNISSGLAIAPAHFDRRLFPFTKCDNAFNTVRNKAGVDKDVSLHSFRHNYCTKSLEAGMSLHCVKDLAGHASITTTEIYLHANPRIKFEQYQLAEKLLTAEAG